MYISNLVNMQGEKNHCQALMEEELLNIFQEDSGNQSVDQIDEEEENTLTSRSNQLNAISVV